MRVKMSKEEFVARFERDQRERIMKERDARRESANVFKQYTWELQTKMLRKRNRFRNK